METKFTPGPWLTTPDGSFPADLRVHTEQRSAIAKVYGEDAKPQHANARLIAAAPRLYEALDWAMRHVTKPTRLIPRQNQEHWDAYHKAMAALAEVRGEQ